MTLYSRSGKINNGGYPISKIASGPVILAVVLALSGCDDFAADDGYESYCNCSLMQLIVNPDKYSNFEVRVQGVVIPVEHPAPESSGYLLLYFSEDDARFINDSNAVLIDLTDQPELEAKLIAEAFGSFVTVRGVFAKQDRSLVISDVSDLRPLAPLPLDSSRNEPVVHEVLVNEPVNAAFLNAVADCPIYENHSYRQIGDARQDALADTNGKHFRIAIVGDSYNAFEERYGERVRACVGELPPSDTIWVLSGTEQCGLIEDTSSSARNYARTYTDVVMQKLIEQEGCE